MDKRARGPAHLLKIHEQESYIITIAFKSCVVRMQYRIEKGQRQTDDSCIFLIGWSSDQPDLGLIAVRVPLSVSNGKRREEAAN